MCQCHNVWVSDVEWVDFPGTGDNDENISRIVGNVLVSWCLCFGFMGKDFLSTGDNEEKISRICGKCARAMVPAFWMWGREISWIRERMTRIFQEQLGNVRCQNVCVLDLGGRFPRYGRQ
jgi:hypothetical protein